ncbi:peptidoglycan-binding domain-containing protein [Mobilicoccus pelagius]|uniref:Peptidoglycan hydrolase-like protein with peptidoglycan-binding domain n=1 Tax=Mobilicoccus pelagius NBRC 104925 TaxID=1089455 RepID=H5URU6_9MICO|nr:peptidoglycan-binding protein [Mobilicoccus pelagius]GAB48454.1 hypothetical protein MOPEL_073_00950 [Mobilicoccus pelagius NBRC 104925]
MTASTTTPRRALATCLAGLTLLGVAAPTATAAGEGDRATAPASGVSSTEGAPADTLAGGHAPAAGDDHTSGSVVLRGPSEGVRAVVLGARLPAPAPTRALPSTLDARPRYQAGVSCDPVDRPGTTALGRLLVDTYGTGVFGVSRFCDGSQSEHHEGRAVDWMLSANDPTQKAVAESFLAWLTANSGERARRLGVQYVIWNRTMWRAYAPERGFAPYSGPNPHTDHIHLSLTWDGAMGRTSWWSGQVVHTQDVGTCRVYAGQPAPIYAGRRTTPCPSSLPAAPASPFPNVAIGSRDRANVARGQQALGITADGVFGRGTQQSVLAYQRSRGLPTSGVLDKATWNRLVPGGTTTSAPAPAPAPTPAPTSGRSDGVTTTRPRPTATAVLPASIVRPLAPWKKTVLRAGSTGSAVKALQRTLGLRLTGRMDAPTTAAVKRLQTRWALRPTGAVDLRTWNRAELTRYPWLGYTTTTWRRGASGPGVVALQKVLRVRADGSFGPATERAVRAIQARYGLPTTGVVDAATWRGITQQAR